MTPERVLHPRRRYTRITDRFRTGPHRRGRALNRVAATALLVVVGGCGDGVNTARLPRGLDVNRLIGVRLPGTPACAFENKARTFTRAGVNQVQGIDVRCAGTTGQVMVFGADRTPPLNDGELRCSDLERAGPGVACGVSRDTVTISTQGQCSGCDAEAAARSLMVRIAEVLSSVGEQATPRFEQSLPSSIDLGRLAGVRLPGTPACTFASEVLGYAEPKTGEIDLRCASPASAKVTIEDGTGGVPELVECRRDHGDFRCAVRRNTLTVRTSTGCSSGRSADCPSAAHALLARLLDFLSTLPEQRCQPCGERDAGPERVRLPASIYGEGGKHLGTLAIPADSVWSYSGTGAPPGFRVTTGKKLLFESPGSSVAEFRLPAGSYRDVRLDAHGYWTLTIRAATP
jgi:hypothetical protein